jgi:hypothetical protein
MATVEHKAVHVQPCAGSISVSLSLSIAFSLLVSVIPSMATRRGALAVSECGFFPPMVSALQPPQRSAFLPSSPARTTQKILVSAVGWRGGGQGPPGRSLDYVRDMGFLTMSVPTAPRCTD